MSPAQYKPTAPPPIARLVEHPPIVNEAAVIATEAPEGETLIADIAISQAASAKTHSFDLISFGFCCHRQASYALRIRAIRFTTGLIFALGASSQRLHGHIRTAVSRPTRQSTEKPQLTGEGRTLRSIAVLLSAGTRT
jgi:hypothetical protein